MKIVRKMFDSKLEAFFQINDSSSSFEGSFEIKNILNNNENVTDCYSKKPFNNEYLASVIRQLDKIPNNNYTDYSQESYPLKLNTEAINRISYTSNINADESIVSNSSNEFDLQIHPPLLPTYKMTPTKQNDGILMSFAKAKGHSLICSSKAKLTNIPKLHYSPPSIRSSMRSNSRFNCSTRFSSLRKVKSVHRNNRTVFNNLTNSLSHQHHTSCNSLSSCNLSEIANHTYQQQQQQQQQEIALKNYCAKDSLISMTTTTVNVSKANPSDITNCNTKQALIDNLTDVFKANYLLSDRGGSVKKVTSVASWTTSFEQLLDDDVGYKLFAEFLKLEYSAENIYFWAAVERYRKTENKTERIVQAEQIVRKHLAIGALEPVNVDSQARNISDEALQNASPDLFNAAQKQVFHLMKFDSYPRFTRSDLYKTCLKAEEDDQPLPYCNQPLDDLLKRNISSISPSKLKKSASNAEDRRGKGLLPWNRKTRSKSRDRINESTKNTNSRNNNNTAQHSKIPIIINNTSFKSPQITRPNSINHGRSLRSSISSFENLPMSGLNVTPSLCRVKFPDGATTMVQTKFTESIGELMQRLMEKRGIHYNHYDVVIKGSNKSAELQAYTQEIAGKEVSIEQRIAFKMDLPDPKVIAVKSKPKKQLIDVIKPILNKYNYSLETVDVLKSNTQEPIDLDKLVTSVEGLRLQVVLRKIIFPSSTELNNYHNEANGTVASNANCRQTYKMQTQNLQAHCKSTDDIASKWNRNNVLIKMKDEGSMANVSLNLEKKLTNIPSLENNVTKKKSSCISIPTKSFIYLNSSNSPKRILEHKKPIIAKLKTGVKLHLAETPSENTDELYETGKMLHLTRSECQKIPENCNEANELPKMPLCTNDDLNRLLLQARANLSPVNTSENFTHSPEKHTHRLSLPTKDKANSSFEESKLTNYCNNDCSNAINKGPPPLPPKPKILPIKPSNWGINNINNLTAEPQKNSSYSLHSKFRNSMRDSPKIKSENNKSISV